MLEKPSHPERQATRFIYRGERAPRLVYVTDGGVQESPQGLGFGACG